MNSLIETMKYSQQRGPYPDQALQEEEIRLREQKEDEHQVRKIEFAKWEFVERMMLSHNLTVVEALKKADELLEAYESAMEQDAGWIK